MCLIIIKTNSNVSILDILYIILMAFELVTALLINLRLHHSFFFDE